MYSIVPDASGAGLRLALLAGDLALGVFLVNATAAWSAVAEAGRLVVGNPPVRAVFWNSPVQPVESEQG